MSRVVWIWREREKTYGGFFEAAEEMVVLELKDVLILPVVIVEA